jgi:hypothetical protein
MTGLVTQSSAIALWTGWPTPLTRSLSRDPATAPSSLPNTASLRTSHDAECRPHTHS